jgi:hypothetical protein
MTPGPGDVPDHGNGDGSAGVYAGEGGTAEEEDEEEEDGVGAAVNEAVEVDIADRGVGADTRTAAGLSPISTSIGCCGLRVLAGVAGTGAALVLVNDILFQSTVSAVDACRRERCVGGLSAATDEEEEGVLLLLIGCAGLCPNDHQSVSTDGAGAGEAAKPLNPPHGLESGIIGGTGGSAEDEEEDEGTLNGADCCCGGCCCCCCGCSIGCCGAANGAPLVMSISRSSMAVSKCVIEYTRPLLATEYRFMQIIIYIQIE